jgi:hypothetical protein
MTCEKNKPVRCARSRVAVGWRASPTAFAAPVGGRAWPSNSCLRSTWSEAVGRFAHIVKCARIWRPVGSAPQPQPPHPRCERAAQSVSGSSLSRRARQHTVARLRVLWSVNDGCTSDLRW